MNKKISFEMLTQNQVVIKTVNTTIIDGKEYQVGDVVTTCYINSIRGREQLQKEIDENYVKIVFAMWGDTPTIVEKSEVSA